MIAESLMRFALAVLLFCLRPRGGLEGKGCRIMVQGGKSHSASDVCGGEWVIFPQTFRQYCGNCAGGSSGAIRSEGRKNAATEQPRLVLNDVRVTACKSKRRSPHVSGKHGSR